MVYDHLICNTTEKEVSKIMSEMIAYCGLHCNECEMFKVTKAKDYEKKKQIAKRWTEELKVEFKPEDIDCEGCKSDVLSGWCRKICKVRPCAEERKVKTCAHCDDHLCEKLKKFLTNEPVATQNLEKIRKTLHTQ
jgi:hypothetical protein